MLDIVVRKLTKILERRAAGDQQHCGDVADAKKS